MKTTDQNLHEMYARIRKAAVLATYFALNDLAPHQVEALPETAWTDAANVLHIHPPSETTRRLVVTLLMKAWTAKRLAALREAT